MDGLLTLAVFFLLVLFVFAVLAAAFLFVLEVLLVIAAFLLVEAG